MLSGIKMNENDIQFKIQKIIKNINQLEKNYNNLIKSLSSIISLKRLKKYPIIFMKI